MANVKIGTHNGAFHCDEVLACSMLKILPEYKDATIIRTRDPEVLKTCDIVVDVGGVFDPSTHRYDHHQKTFIDSMASLNKGKWVTKLSSAGLVYAHFGKNIISQIVGTKDETLVQRIYDKVYEKFMEEIDAVDNGIATHDGTPRYHVTTTLSSRVANLRPAWNDPTQDFDAGFYKAMSLVGAEFVDRINFYSNVWWPARSLVADAIEKRFETWEGGKIISFDNGGCPWKEHFFELEKDQNIEGDILFCLFEDETNKEWSVAAVPVEDQSFVSRMKLKEDWCALRDNELSEKAGIEGCVFVHATGFTGGNKTKEGALQMAIKTIEANKCTNGK